MNGRVLVCLSGLMVLGGAWNGSAAEAQGMKWTFDGCAIGAVPKEWKIEATKQDGPLATWAVVEEKRGDAATKALALTKPNHTSRPTFNLCWTDSIHLSDVRIKLRFNRSRRLSYSCQNLFQ